MHGSIRSAFASLGLALATLVSPNLAGASQAFPDHLVTKLQMPCAPGCQLCHLDASGGPLKINAKFGEAVKFAGATVVLTDNLDTALAKLTVDNTDSDGDGTSDIAELQAGTDPNAAGAELCGGIKYGCGASTIARTPSKESPEPIAVMAAATALLGMLLLRRRPR